MAGRSRIGKQLAGVHDPLGIPRQLDRAHRSELGRRRIALELAGLELAYAVFGPLTHAAVALGLACLLQLPQGDAILLMVLAASASYIAVPAVLRYAVPEANPSLYFGLSLGVTFPLNILLGIPLYAQMANAVLG